MSEPRNKESAAIREAAAEWVVRLSTNPELREGSEFFAWMRRSPEHVKEYLRAEAAWLAMDGAVREDKGDVAELLRAKSPNVIALSATSHTRSEPLLAPAKTVKASVGRRVALAAAIVLSIGLIASSVWLVRQSYVPVYSTEIGEQRRVVLADGSVVELNTSSTVRVRFNEKSRTIYLDSGEAFFSVAQDAARPFRVISDAAEVRALGTQFNIYRQSGRTVVTVVAGRVMARAQDEGAAAPIELGAGEAVSIAGPRSESPRSARAAPADARVATAWRMRRLIFNDEPLADAVAEFNRYNRQQLVVADADLASERISGVFDADQPQALVKFLAQQGNVRSRPIEGSRLLLIPAHASSAPPGE
jgi:transmembrane sensor